MEEKSRSETPNHSSRCESALFLSGENNEPTHIGCYGVPVRWASVKTKAIYISGAVLLLAGLILQAAEKSSLPPETAGFKAGPGAEIAMTQCLLCHSADYVSTQPRLSRTAWKASVQKMKDKYGAPLPDEKVEALVDYLVKTYGAEMPK